MTQLTWVKKAKEGFIIIACGVRDQNIGHAEYLKLTYLDLYALRNP